MPDSGIAAMRQLWVSAEGPAWEQAAQALARELDCPLQRQSVAADSLPGGGILVRVGRELALQETGPGAPGPVRVDFGSRRMRHRRRAGHNELLGRAVGVSARGSSPAVLDATAGLGRDAFVLADLGCRVWLCERDPVIGRLLACGLRRALEGDPWLAAVASRMTLVSADARRFSPGDMPPVDAIYLDPMFARESARARPKKDMAVFRALLPGEGPDQRREAAQLLAWALEQPVRRVAVKRPVKEPPLGDVSPSHSLRGRAVRFDVYIRP